MSWQEERQKLLETRINELQLRIEGSPLDPMIERLYEELAAAGLSFKPSIYLTDEWGCPEGVPVIGVPFYLADRRLSDIEAEEMDNLESGDESMMYLRHEAGHAFNYAYKLYETEEWHEVFGPYSRPYVEDYRPNPFSRDFVRHIAGWYGQKHPDEDFSETFAVWLTPGSAWREEYNDWGAMRKLEYLDRTMKSIGASLPLVDSSSFDLPVEEMDHTVGAHYENWKEKPIEIPGWFDGDLKQLFEQGDANTESAEPFLRTHQKSVVTEITYWTGLRENMIRALVDHLVGRVAELRLTMNAGQEIEYLTSFTSMVTTLAVNYLHHGSFIPGTEK